jgi:hypothetical protein
VEGPEVAGAAKSPAAAVRARKNDRIVRGFTYDSTRAKLILFRALRPYKRATR